MGVLLLARNARRSEGRSPERGGKSSLVDLGRIELPTDRCHRPVLPLNYRPKRTVVGAGGIEPPAFTMST